MDHTHFTKCDQWLFKRKKKKEKVTKKKKQKQKKLKNIQFLQAAYQKFSLNGPVLLK